MKEEGEQGTKIIEVYIGNDEDVILARQKTRTILQEMGFSLLEQTRIITAVSELARNVVVHAKEGKMTVYRTAQKPGLRLVFEDKGPGIPDIDRAMQEGFSTVGSLGLGMKGARKLTDEFDIRSEVGKGTTVSFIKWL